jgi:hypothetical protein
MKTYWGSDGIAPRILYLGTRWRWVVSFKPRPLYPQGKRPWYPVNRRLDGPQIRSGLGGEQKNSQPLPRLEPPIIQPVPQRYTTELSWLLLEIRVGWETYALSASTLNLPVGTRGPLGHLHTASRSLWKGHWNTQPASPHSETVTQREARLKFWSVCAFHFLTMLEATSQHNDHETNLVQSGSNMTMLLTCPNNSPLLFSCFHGLVWEVLVLEFMLQNFYLRNSVTEWCTTFLFVRIFFFCIYNSSLKHSYEFTVTC